VKVNYALDHPIPWRSESLQEAGTVHLGADSHGLTRWLADLKPRPFRTNRSCCSGK